MTQALINTFGFISHAFGTNSELPLLTVAAFAGSSLVLYGLTRGKEFLIAGYSAALLMFPLIK